MLKKYFTTIFLVLFLIFFSFSVFSVVSHKAEEIKPGTFGGDFGGGNFSFLDNLTVSGFVGIGTSSPSYDLDVVGNVSVSDSVLSSRVCIANDCRVSWPDPSLSGWSRSNGVVSLVTSTDNVSANTFFVDNTNGRVGIGTTSPSATLDVVGTLNVSSNSSDDTYFYLSNSNVSGVDFWVVKGAYHNAVGDYYSDFVVSQFDSSKSSFSRDRFVIDDGSNSLYPVDSFTFAPFDGDRGYFRIRLLNDSGSKDVFFEAYNGYSESSPTYGSADKIFFGGASYDPYTMTVDVKNRRVGIGTTSPGNTLQVVGSISSRGWDAVFVANDSNNNKRHHLIGIYHGWDPDAIYIAGYNYYNPSGGDVNKSATKKVYIGKPERLMVDLNSGNVGIGTSSPSEKLYVSGNIYATGSITSGSDIRLKDNISFVSNNVLSKFDNLRPFSYVFNYHKRDLLRAWKILKDSDSDFVKNKISFYKNKGLVVNDSFVSWDILESLVSDKDVFSFLEDNGFRFSDNNFSDVMVGLSAQDLKKIFPKVVYKDKSTDTYAVSYNELVPYLVEAIKELKSEVDVLKQQVNSNTVVVSNGSYKEIVFENNCNITKTNNGLSIKC